MASGSERCNAQTFTRELCVALDLPPPNLALGAHADDDCVFERSVVFQHGDGSSTTATAPLTIAQVAACIGGKAEPKSQLPEILATLVALSRAPQVNDEKFAAA